MWNKCELVEILCGINVSLGSDLSERIITRTRYNYKTLGVIILE